MSEKNDFIKGMIANKNWVFGIVCYDGKPIPTEKAWKYKNHVDLYVRAKNQYEAIAQAKLLVDDRKHYKLFSVQEA